MGCTVNIASPLRIYTAGLRSVAANGATVHTVLGELEQAYPGMRFRMIDEQGRIRQHIRIFVNETAALTLDAPVPPAATVHLLCALSGG